VAHPAEGAWQHGSGDGREAAPETAERLDSRARPWQPQLSMQSGTPIGEDSVDAGGRDAEFAPVTLVATPIDAAANTLHSLCGMTQHRS